MVLRQVGVMLLIGGVVGIAAALALGRVAASLLYGPSNRARAGPAGARCRQSVTVRAPSTASSR
jgi:hypothetical protein